MLNFYAHLTYPAESQEASLVGPQLHVLHANIDKVIQQRPGIGTRWIEKWNVGKLHEYHDIPYNVTSLAEDLLLRLSKHFQVRHVPSCRENMKHVQEQT